MAISRNRLVRGMYLVFGILSLVLGVVGLFLPVMPTTVFVLLAAYFFARSSERIYRWILDHPQFGPLIGDYHAGLGIPLYAKVWAVGGIASGLGLAMALFVDGMAGRLLLTMLGIAIIWYVVRQPTKKPAS